MANDKGSLVSFHTNSKKIRVDINRGGSLGNLLFNGLKETGIDHFRGFLIH